MFYYPDVGTDQVTRELLRPTYSIYRVNNVIDEISALPAETPDLAGLDALLGHCDLVTLHGLLDDFPRRCKWSNRLQLYAVHLSNAISKRIGTLPLRHISAGSQARFVDHLQPFASSAIDEAVFELLLKRAASRLGGEPDTETLILACAKRLIDSNQFGPRVREICACVVPESSSLYADFQELASR
jgi:hypothetical protein